MTDSNHEPTVDYGRVLSDVWDNAEEANIDADCSPTKVCRNAREFTFDGISEGEEDLNTSWKSLLQREGKLAAPGEAKSIRDLVLGGADD